MRTVADPTGRRYLLVKRSRESSLVRDPLTGEERYLPTDDLETVAGASVLETAAAGLPEIADGPLAAVSDARGLGLLVLLADRGPTPVRELLGGTDLCESDVHGIVGDLRAAGLLERATVAGEGGYRTTPEAESALSRVRDKQPARDGNETER